MSISGVSATISGLMGSTTYTIEVAAVNIAGVGVYSDPVTANTDSMEIYA